MNFHFIHYFCCYECMRYNSDSVLKLNHMSFMEDHLSASKVYKDQIFGNRDLFLVENVSTTLLRYPRTPGYSSKPFINGFSSTYCHALFSMIVNHSKWFQVTCLFNEICFVHIIPSLY